MSRPPNSDLQAPLRWYAIHTKPRQESLAQTNLQREGIETFYPKLKRRKTIRRVRKWVTGPLFANYIFAKFNVIQFGRLVKYSNGVINIVSFGGKPATVDQPIIDAVAANYREASRARSKAEFVSKIETSTQEADESLLWLELLNEGCGIDTPALAWLLKETNELIAIFVTMAKNTKRRMSEET